MGTTAEKLTYLNETKTKLKDMLNLGGASLTTEPFRQYVDTLKNRYLYFMNNGTQEVWDNWEKVVGEGTTITLNNTEEAPMKINLKGNTSQESTTGINLFCPDAPSKTQVGITVTNNGDGTYTINGTATANLSIPLTVTSLGKELTGGQPYTMAMEILSNGGSGGSITVEIRKNGTPQYNFFVLTPQSATGMKVQVATPSEDATIGGIAYYCGSGAVVNNLKIRPYLVKGSYTASNIPAYEPYTGGTASPNPDYPQDIHVVSGDNTIEICGRNLGNPNTLFDEMYNSGYANPPIRTIVDNKNAIYFSTYYSHNKPLYVTKYKENTQYTFRVVAKVDGSTLRYLYIIIDYTDGTKSSASIPNQGTSWDELRIVSTANKTIKDFYFSYSNAGYWYIDEYSFNIIEGDTTDYEPYQGASYQINLGDIELCKIGDYQDRFIRNSGKNLLPTTLYNLALNASGETVGLIVSNPNRNAYYCEIEPNTTYYISRSSVGTATYWYYAYTDVEPKGGVMSLSFANMGSDLQTQITTPSNAKYLCVFMGGGLSNNVMVSKENTLYEPYGNGDWYLEKNIGKYTFTGNETWSSSTYGTNTWSYYPFYNSYNESKLQILSNIFRGIPASERNTGGNNTIYTGNTIIVIRNTTLTTLQEVRNATSGNYIYYVLSTPTYTKIEGTLKEQLNALAKSYEGQTNISQNNNDLPFELSITALKEMA